MTNRIKAVILDWAGTVLDHGSRAPMGAFVEAFARFGVTISIADARGPMGMAKRDHIRLVGTAPAVAAAWRAKHGRDFDEAAIDAIFDVFEPLNVAAVEAHSAIIPGVRDALGWCTARGIRIGSTTGYTRPIMEVLAPLAAAAGYVPDNIVCAGDLAAGRPSPLMMYRCFADLGVWPAAAVVKVDDTEPGIAEGLAAGSWTVGVTLTGNGVGLSAEELAALPEGERAALREAAAAPLLAAGAHLVIDSVADLPGAVAALSARAEAGESP
jgi:phosphonoacetaldehyde hydrolase